MTAQDWARSGQKLAARIVVSLLVAGSLMAGGPTGASATSICTWAVAPVPNPGYEYNSLSDVTATSSINAWAVGGFNTDTYEYRTLILHWDGRAWKRQWAPSPGLDATLTGVDAVSSTMAYAVGYYSGETVEPTRVERWNGTACKVQASPNPGTNMAGGGNLLWGVAALSASDAWAVGEYSVWDAAEGTFRERNLIERWDGTAWKVQTIPNVSTVFNQLIGVAATSSDVWAVGQYFDEGGPTQSLVLHCR